MVGKDMVPENVERSVEIYNKAKGRGPAILKRLTKIKDNEERVKVIYNDRGQPIGVGKKDLASYVGMLAKSFVPLTYKDWHKVPNTLKEDLWNAIQVKFDVDPKTEKDVLSSMGRSWRSFKTQLTRSWINPLKDNPVLLKYPPAKYRKLIDRSEWDEFVRNRLSESFQSTSKLQRERRAKNKYHHRMSKKGYVGLEEELKKKMGSSYEDNRSFLWTKARQKKDGEYGDDATKEVAEKMLALKRQVDDGSLVLEGTSDILTIALGTPEHSGRVRGQGFGVTPTGYFNLPSGPRRGSKRHISELESKLHEERKKRKETEQILQDLQAQSVKVHNELVTSMSSDKAASYKSDNSKYEISSANVWDSSGNSKGQTHCLKSKGDEERTQELVSYPMTNIGMGKKCRLAIESKTNIVAEGLVFERDGLDEKIHHVLLGEHNVRVSITKVFSPDAILPILVSDEMKIVKDALGSLVAWPKEFVLLGVEEEKNDGGDDEHGGENDDGGCALINGFTLTLETMETIEIMIPLEKELFGEENVECYIFKNGLLGFCAMKALDVTCIATYMRHLYDKFESSREIVKFFNPASMCAASNVGISRLITKRLQNVKRNQICFIPYYIKAKFHWVLIVIDCSSMTIFWLDSLNTKPDEQLKFYINAGINSLLVNGKRRQPPTWNIIKCPTQPGNVECGYFVMKFMRELMEDPSQSIENKIGKLATKETYTIDEINEIRIEFMEFIVDHMRTE